MGKLKGAENLETPFIILNSFPYTIWLPELLKWANSFSLLSSHLQVWGSLRNSVNYNQQKIETTKIIMDNL